MATIPSTPFQSLSLAEQVKLVERAYLSYYGVTTPVTDILAKTKLPSIVADVTRDLDSVKALYKVTGNDRTATVSGLGAFVKYVPELAGSTVDIGTLLDVFTGVQTSLNSLINNPLIVSSTLTAPVIPTPPVVIPPVIPTPLVVIPPVIPTPLVVIPPVIPTPVVTPPIPAPQKSTDILSTILGAGAVVVGALSVIDALTNTATGLSAEKQSAQGKATQQDVANFEKNKDWRVRLSLAPGATYLYKDSAITATDLLYPLKSTDGVIFPYTPAISVAYAAHYDSSTLTHSNYKIFQYGSSSVDSITITCDFTAQDTSEANYLLAVIHFFKSATKMFYGQDENPKPGTPPPLCYLSGLGDFQFDAHPLAITGFNYTLPTDVDYVRAGRPAAGAGVNTSPTLTKDGGSLSATINRLIGSLLTSGAQAAPPKFGLTAAALQSTSDATYVPTKMSLSITAIPIVTRNDISNNFSLKDYATGKLLQGSKRQGGGIW